MLLALPVGSVAYERSVSSLRRLKTWSRASMGERRLKGLALLYIHRDSEVGYVDPSVVLKRFDASGHLRIGRVFHD